jgi:hypothetical protein
VRRQFTNLLCQKSHLYSRGTRIGLMLLNRFYSPDFLRLCEHAAILAQKHDLGNIIVRSMRYTVFDGG